MESISKRGLILGLTPLILAPFKKSGEIPVKQVSGQRETWLFAEQGNLRSYIYIIKRGKTTNLRNQSKCAI